MPAARIARCRPRLLITVVTSVLDASSPASCIASARITMMASPSMIVAVGIDGQAAVGVAVMGQAEVGAVREHHRLLQRLHMGGAAAVVDVQPVGFCVDRDDVRRPRPGTPAARRSTRRRWRSRRRRSGRRGGWCSALPAWRR